MKLRSLFHCCLSPRTHLAIAWLAITVFAGGSLNATVLYVSPDGGGTNFTLTQPGNLFDARNYVRTISTNSTGDIVVYLLGGTYQLTNSFQLQENATNHDSGTGGNNVIYENAPGQQPVISGGMAVTNWSLADPVTNIWRAQVGLGVNSRQLYVNGVRAIRARSAVWPNIDATDRPGFGRTPAGYWTTNTAMQHWRNVTNIELVTRWHWEQRRCPIAAIAGTNIVMQSPCWSIFTNKMNVGKTKGPSWIENAYELMISPGMWYLDQATGWLYYIPRPGENLTNGAVVVLPVVEKLVDAEGGDFMTFHRPIHNIVLSGLTFEYATWLFPSSFGYAGYGCGNFLLPSANDSKMRAKTLGNVSFKEAANIVITNCVFTHLGGSGIDFTYASNCLVSANSFDDISGDGISLGEVSESKGVPYEGLLASNVIQDNFIRRVGQDYENDAGIFLAQQHNSLVTHNDVDNAPYSGIVSVHGFNDRYVANYIGRTCQTLEDGSAIYAPAPQSNSWIIGNYFKDGNEHAIYFDVHATGFTAASNVIDDVAQTSFGWIFWHEAKGDSIRDTFCNGTSRDFRPGPNTFTNTVYVKGQFWPPAARQIILNAGLEPAFAGLKSPEFLVNDTEPAFDVVPSDWTYVARKRLARVGEYQGDVHTCTNAGDAVQYTFTANGISWIGDLDEDASTNVAVYLDGAYQQTVNCWSSTLVPQTRLFSATNLPAGPHTLKLINNHAGGTMYVDALAVTPANYWLTATPNTGGTSVGRAFTSVIRLDTFGGYGGTTTFSASGLPAGTTASFNPPSVTGAGFTTMTITPGTSSPTGHYQVTVTGVGGGVTNIAIVNLTEGEPRRR